MSPCDVKESSHVTPPISALHRVRPLYLAAAILFPGAKSRLPQIELNREECKRIMAEARERGEGNNASLIG